MSMQIRCDKNTAIDKAVNEQTSLLRNTRSEPIQKMLSSSSKSQSYLTEAQTIASMALPMFFGFISQNIITLISLSFLGHSTSSQQSAPLAGFALGSAFCGITGISLGFGSLAAFDTLASQALGAGHTFKMIILLFRAFSICFLCFIIVAALWLHADMILPIL